MLKLAYNDLIQRKDEADRKVISFVGIWSKGIVKVTFWPNDQMFKNVLVVDWYNYSLNIHIWLHI